ncbi:GNAT family N-acetyltransferase [Kocuria rhizophila]|uniref:GNAT family N-acetyltransferase n=1 Tax=Kocuria rhizophila TaxID=72000 RepID=UPI001EF5DC07|nr:GNAT family protein [Kocuria rhizophila]MCG7424118.1 GNAT family N-acetyltransferase [Kocuria rhizophila]MCT1880809.1 GNAT family N-acetyltransferase [Kocuria rhizophila]MCT2248869.1 GNAT family N-acetyltransferase [Kocuria rhizophila]
MTWTPVTLRGRLVRLEPLTREHLDGLVEATEDGSMWDRWYTSVPSPDGMVDAIEQRLAWQEEGFMLPFTTVRQSDDAVLGMTSFYDPQWAVPRVSIGHTWNRASTHGTGTNAESKLLLMTHVFEELGCRCVRYETSWANQQSRAAIERLGARLDGVLRGDRLERNGVPRDTVVYSVLEHEWPSVRTGLETRVARR